MSKTRKIHSYYLLIANLLVLSLFCSCLFQQKPGKSRNTKEAWLNNFNASKSVGDPTSDDTTAVGGGSSLDNSVSDTAVITELLYLVDPKTGTVKKKVTIPKNSNGYLYLTGINLDTLSNKILKVRFSFGRDLEPIEIPAIVSSAPGLTPQTGIKVLVLDLKDRPFNNIRLLYDLFDYPSSSSGETNPTQDPYSESLYCRGLKKENDITFIKGGDSDGNGKCDNAADKCLFSFAKIVDRGFSYSTDGFGTTSYIYPTLANIDTSLNKSGYNQQPLASLTDYEKNLELQNQIKKCLPNTEISSTNVTYLNGATINSNAPESLNINPDGTTTTTSYKVDAPYEKRSTDLWEIESNAILSTNKEGIFVDTDGYKSRLFPRAGKMELRSETEYIGVTAASTSSNATANDPSIAVMDKLNLYSNTTSEWMNGCSIRVSNFDANTNEGISSCNVTGKISILALNSSSGVYELITESNDINLQLIRPSLLNSNDENVLYTSFKSCFNSSGCAVDECCYNQRCWSKTMVSQCFEEAHVEGNKNTGEVCSSDYECSSLCCNGGKCQVHDTSLDTPVYCSKPTGSSCVSSEWCHRANVPTCLLVTTGTDAAGNITCAVKCYNQLVNGSCVNGKCVDPDQGTSPSQINFNPANPDCSQAQAPPTTI